MYRETETIKNILNYVKPTDQLWFATRFANGVAISIKQKNALAGVGRIPM